MVLISFSLFVAVTVINLHCRGEKKNKVPPWLKKVCICHCVSCVCVRYLFSFFLLNVVFSFHLVRIIMYLNLDRVTPAVSFSGHLPLPSTVDFSLTTNFKFLHFLSLCIIDRARMLGEAILRPNPRVRLNRSANRSRDIHHGETARTQEHPVPSFENKQIRL